MTGKPALHNFASARDSQGLQSTLGSSLEAMPVFGGRYTASRLLKDGTQFQTLLAHDEQTGEPVIIKTIHLGIIPVGMQMRLEQEGRQLCELQCLDTRPLLDMGTERDCLYFAMPYVHGVSLETKLQSGPLGLRDTLSLGICLFHSLRELHAKRILHRSVKPGNVIIDQRYTPLHATLIDIGLAHTVLTEVLPQKQATANVLYTSPEQAGAMDADVGEPADLYSAGIVLFESLTGNVPFQGETIGKLLFEHMTEPVPELTTPEGPVPHALEEVIQRLLRKDPRDRYQSADGALTDLQAILAALDQGNSDPHIVIGASDLRTSLTEPALVGRTRELNRIDEAINQVRQGPTSLLMVEGESGSGKTRLLVEMARRGVGSGMWVMRGNASTEVGQRPFHLLDGVVNEFVREAKAHPEIESAMLERLGSHRDAVIAALPHVAEQLEWSCSGATMPEQFGENRSVYALAHFLHALGTPTRPAMIILDDCHWSDELTVKLIERWNVMRLEPEALRTHVLLVLAFRSEELPADHKFRRLDPFAHLRLGAFSADETRQLVESMAGPLPDQAVDVLCELSGGSPFMASAVLHGLIESKALVPIRDGWRVEPMALANLQSSNQAGSFLTHRIELLPDTTVGLLSSGAILGKEFDLALASTLAGQTTAQSVTALNEARGRHMVWVRADGCHCAFVHDKIREALLSRLTSDQRNELHRRAAVYLQQHAPSQVSELAYHFDAAGEHEQALSYALEAAKQARARHALEVAEQQYRIAARGAATAPVPLRFQIAEGLGNVLMLRGCYDESESLFQQATSLAVGQVSHAPHLREAWRTVSEARDDSASH